MTDRRWSYGGFFAAVRIENRKRLTVCRFETRWERDEWVKAVPGAFKITRRGAMGTAIFWRLERAVWKNNSTEVTL